MDMNEKMDNLKEQRTLGFAIGLIGSIEKDMKQLTTLGGDTLADEGFEALLASTVHNLEVVKMRLELMLMKKDVEDGALPEEEFRDACDRHLLKSPQLCLVMMKTEDTLGLPHLIPENELSRKVLNLVREDTKVNVYTGRIEEE